MFQGDMRYTHFPYCLQKLEDGRYVALNRKYKPVGLITSDHISYEDSPAAVRIEGLDPTTAAQIVTYRQDRPDTLYLYDDGCIPKKSATNMERYLQRLSKLMMLKTYVG